MTANVCKESQMSVIKRLILFFIFILRDWLYMAQIYNMVHWMMLEICIINVEKMSITHYEEYKQIVCSTFTMILF